MLIHCSITVSHCFIETTFFPTQRFEEKERKIANAVYAKCKK